ncbi:hypothetical protein JRI60_48520 [Archangium violaceum]|uniref:SitI6 family double-CXXCG motif immunity protein n=1 Tax=Archangium violaceum TaxID=83451 RepID=UPI00194F77C8|nr:double-CXXCG motif protein [Archangium violaceum]QRN96746.1 hypothetical protein JRI60_48520 [Archangium violaceum]
MKFYGLELPERFRGQGPSKPDAWPYTGVYTAFHKWKLPGVNCPACRAIWGGGPAYPGADLSGLPEAKKLEEAYLEEDFAEFERLRELVRPLVPVGALLEPGSKFGPLVGSARGTFAQLFMIHDDLLIRREALEQLRAEGIRGLNAFRTQLRFRQKQAPELLELQIEPHGLLHRDCIPPGKAEPCAKCGRYDFSLPGKPLLDRASLPEHLDLFRLANFTTVIVASEHLVKAIRRLGFEEVSIRELPLR